MENNNGNNNGGNSGNKPAVREERKPILPDSAAMEAILLSEKRSWFYQLALNLFAAVFKLLFFVRIEGKENIPAEGCVIMGNHRAWADPFLLAMCTRDREIRFMGKKELWCNSVFAWIARQVRGIPVDRGNVDMAAIRMSMTVLKAGHTLGIFPEGTRSKTGVMGPLQSGAAMLALRSRRPVVAIYIDGNYKPFRRMVVRVGKPIDMDDLLAGRITKEACDALTARIEASFAELSGGRSLPAGRA